MCEYDSHVSACRAWSLRGDGARVSPAAVVYGFLRQPYLEHGGRHLLLRRRAAVLGLPPPVAPPHDAHTLIRYALLLFMALHVAYLVLCVMPRAAAVSLVLLFGATSAGRGRPWLES